MSPQNIILKTNQYMGEEEIFSFFDTQSMGA